MKEVRILGKVSVSKPVYESLINHLVEIEEEKNKVIEEYYYDMTTERLDFESLINSYVINIGKYIKNAEVANTSENYCPFVIINSIVEVEDLKDNSIEKFQIISPFLNQNSLDEDSASYLSPIGKSLLLKKQGEQVVVKTPMENIEYRVKSIELPSTQK